jgi:hypothetical protein
MDKIKIFNIFNGLGVPKNTYVAQESGHFEKLLRQGINEAGTLCLVTGSSKTGKTTLYNNVLAQMDKVPLLVRCDTSITSLDFWAKPLESIDFNRIKETSKTAERETEISAKVGGTIGWAWLAGLIGEVSLGIKDKKAEVEIRERILSKPSANHLIPLLKNSNAILVVEDFHYLQETVQREIFQQWKAFTDEQVSVIVVGTTHHGVDLAYANQDLVGRIQQVDLKRWTDADLFMIAKKGFNALGQNPPIEVIKFLSQECAGLPILMQQACGQLFFDRDLEEIEINHKVLFNMSNARSALYNVATTRYRQYETWYNRLKVGPRIGARKYETYELLLALFTQNPPKFHLLRHEIDKRLASAGLEPCKVPPQASVNSTLKALAKFQEKNGFSLLEWSEKDQAIYILEPAFLFYLRWRQRAAEMPTVFESIIMALLQQSYSYFKSSTKPSTETAHDRKIDVVDFELSPTPNDDEKNQ